MPFKEQTGDIQVTLVEEREQGYAAICVGVVDIGTNERETAFGVKRQTKTKIFWELPEVQIEGEDGKTESMVVSRLYTKSLDKRGNLRKDLSSWRGRPFADTELASFGFEKLKFAPCSLYMKPYEKEGKTYNGIEQISKWTGDKLTPTKEFWCFDWDLVQTKAQADSEIEQFPDWLKEAIKKSEEYIEMAAEATAAATPNQSPLTEDDVMF